MRKFLKIVFIVFLWCNTATAESELPPCQGMDDMQWTNCLGTYLNKVLDEGYTRDYTGEFGSLPGKREGKGSSKVYKNGILEFTFYGKFKDDKPNGLGTETYANGDKFVGEFKDDKLNGQGTYIYANGDKFVGEYKDDKLNGLVTETYANGDIKVSLFKDDKFIKVISSTVKKQSSAGSKTFTGYTYITMMDKGIADNGIWGTRCNYSDGSYREIKSSDPGGPPPRC